MKVHLTHKLFLNKYMRLSIVLLVFCMRINKRMDWCYIISTSLENQMTHFSNVNIIEQKLFYKMRNQFSNYCFYEKYRTVIPNWNNKSKIFIKLSYDCLRFLYFIYLYSIFLGTLHIKSTDDEQPNITDTVSRSVLVKIIYSLDQSILTRLSL